MSEQGYGASKIMEQESWKVDAEEMACQPPEGPILCRNNCGFFGSASTMNLCSQCYRDVVVKQAKAAEAAATAKLELAASSAAGKSSSAEVENKTPKDAISSENSSPSSQPIRCFMCRKHVDLMGFKCRCGNVFCSAHRYNDKHDCPFDYRSAAQAAIGKANPVIKADKIDKI